MASTNLSSLEPLEAYVSPDELADELVLQKTLLFTLDSTAEGSEQAKAEIEAEIVRIETQLRELRGGVTEPHIGASVLGGSSQQHRPNNIESSSPFSSYNLSPFSCEFIPIVSCPCKYPDRRLVIAFSRTSPTHISTSHYLHSKTNKILQPILSGATQ